MQNSIRTAYQEELYPNGNLKTVTEYFLDVFGITSMHIYNFSLDGTMHDHYEVRGDRKICHHGMEKRKWNDRDRDVIRFILTGNILNTLCDINEYDFCEDCCETQKSNKLLVKKRNY